MPPTGQDIVKLARKHVGEKYRLGAVAPKDNPRWTGDWDCAEFTSWLVYQLIGRLYGCTDNTHRPSIADAYTGAWMRDAAKIGKKVSLAEAERTPGAMVVRHGVGIGHIVVSKGDGRTVEAHSQARGVIEHQLAGRRWDIGVLVPGFTYKATAGGGTGPAPPRVVIYKLADPMMRGDAVKQIQRALKAAGFDPGPLDGVYGGQTAAAVNAYQVRRGLIADGEVGPTTARSLGVTLPRA